MANVTKMGVSSVDDDYEVDDENVIGDNRRSHFSLKDTGVILSLATLLSVSLVMGSLGVEGIKEKLSTNDVWNVALAVFVFIVIFSGISYLLIKMMAHYLVYLAVGTLLAIVFPVSPSRQRRTLKEIYRKAEKRD